LDEVRSEDVHGVKVGKHVMIDGEPSRVVDVKRSAPGKHGHAKFRISAVGIFDGKKRVILLSGGDKIDVPIIEKQSAQILSVQGNTAQAMDLTTYETFEITVPEELQDKVVDGSQVIYWKVMGRRIIKQLK